MKNYRCLETHQIKPIVWTDNSYSREILSEMSNTFLKLFTSEKNIAGKVRFVNNWSTYISPIPVNLQDLIDLLPEIEQHTKETS